MLKGVIMQVSKRGNSSVVMIPVAIVDVFDLHEGIFILFQ